MNIDNGTKLQNIGMQLKNMGLEIQNIGTQMKNMMLDNMGIQLENLGVQASNIGIQIVDIGMQFSNMIMIQNQNIANMFNQMIGFQMPLNQNKEIMNQMNLRDSNNNHLSNNSVKIINCVFTIQTGSKINIQIKENETIEELIKLYLQRAGLDYNDIEKKNIYFWNNNQRINIHDKRMIKDLATHNSEFVYFKVFWKSIIGSEW